MQQQQSSSLTVISEPQSINSEINPQSPPSVGFEPPNILVSPTGHSQSSDDEPNYQQSSSSLPTGVQRRNPIIDIKHGVDDHHNGDDQRHHLTRKRSSNCSSKCSSTTDKRIASKVCRVCGDKAYSYNFNVITCESCKAFFRRNANKEKEIRCPFSDQCDINCVSRRFCQRCRLQKCFRVGMKKEWIMSEEARLEKKQRIIDNRGRRQQEPIRTTFHSDNRQQPQLKSPDKYTKISMMVNTASHEDDLSSSSVTTHRDATDHIFHLTNNNVPSSSSQHCRQQPAIAGFRPPLISPNHQATTTIFADTPHPPFYIGAPTDLSKTCIEQQVLANALHRQERLQMNLHQSSCPAVICPSPSWHQHVLSAPSLPTLLVSPTDGTMTTTSSMADRVIKTTTSPSSSDVDRDRNRDRRCTCTCRCGAYPEGTRIIDAIRKKIDDRSVVDTVRVVALLSTQT